MPIYEYFCPTHGRFSSWAKVSERHKETPCTKCQTLAPYVISAPRVFGDFQPYVSPASGKLIEGRRQRIEDFARTNTRPYDPGEKEQLVSRQKEFDKAQEKAVDAAVETTLTELLNG